MLWLGIARIKHGCEEHGVVAPIFEEFVHGFEVTLFKEKLNGKEGEEINNLYDFMKHNPSKRVKYSFKTLER